MGVSIIRGGLGSGWNGPVIGRDHRADPGVLGEHQRGADRPPLGCEERCQEVHVLHAGGRDNDRGEQRCRDILRRVVQAHEREGCVLVANDVERVRAPARGTIGGAGQIAANAAAQAAGSAQPGLGHNRGQSTSMIKLPGPSAGVTYVHLSRPYLAFCQQGIRLLRERSSPLVINMCWPPFFRRFSKIEANIL